MGFGDETTLLLASIGCRFISLSCVFLGESHSKTKIQPDTVSVDSPVFVKLIVVWSESSNTTQSIVATCHNENLVPPMKRHSYSLQVGHKIGKKSICGHHYFKTAQDTP